MIFHIRALVEMLYNLNLRATSYFLRSLIYLYECYFITAETGLCPKNVFLKSIDAFVKIFDEDGIIGERGGACVPIFMEKLCKRILADTDDPELVLERIFFVYSFKFYCSHAKCRKCYTTYSKIPVLRVPFFRDSQDIAEFLLDEKKIVLLNNRDAKDE